ncbi:unnamed protein product [Allacma fusca]|uniref:Daxx histone-binding domain-containing protein n=1 Tax=Allacma fusca TaxID=39272 RepID=A0A8J2LR47_9HEXA|nr:unnamed protein product [Allacma fusca]
MICRKTGCNFYTGRPIEKRITLQGITKCAEVSEAVEKFMNSKPIHFIPDYHDIQKVVTDFNAQARPPPLCDSEIESTAKDLFNEVIRVMRTRRRQDMEIVCPVETVTEDPADNDEELRKKLEENVKLRKSEQEVIEKFVKQQEESKEDAKEVEEDPESSAGESDDEDEEEDLTAEQGSNSGTDEATQDDQQFTRDQVEEESDSESEDDEPPPKKQRCSPKKSPRKDKTSPNSHK